MSLWDHGKDMHVIRNRGTVWISFIRNSGTLGWTKPQERDHVNGFHLNAFSTSLKLWFLGWNSIACYRTRESNKICVKIETSSTCFRLRWCISWDWNISTLKSNYFLKFLTDLKWESPYFNNFNGKQPNITSNRDIFKQLEIGCKILDHIRNSKIITFWLFSLFLIRR